MLQPGSILAPGRLGLGFGRVCLTPSNAYSWTRTSLGRRGHSIDPVSCGHIPHNNHESCLVTGCNSWLFGNAVQLMFLKILTRPGPRFGFRVLVKKSQLVATGFLTGSSGSHRVFSSTRPGSSPRSVGSRVRPSLPYPLERILLDPHQPWA
jgi:hypothetical protein